jgi:hypothetical protein
VYTTKIIRRHYQSTNSVIRAEPVTTRVGTAVLDLVERLVKIAKNLLTLLHVRVAVRMAIGLVLMRFRRMGLEAEDARNAAHNDIERMKGVCSKY